MFNNDLVRVMYSVGAFLSVLVNLVVLGFVVTAIVRRPRLPFILIAIACVLSLIVIGSNYFLFLIAPTHRTGPVYPVLIAQQLLHLLDLLLWGIGIILLACEAPASPPPARPPAQS